MSNQEPNSQKTVYVTYVCEGQKLSKTYSYESAKKAGVLSSQTYALLDNGIPNTTIPSPCCLQCGYSLRDFEKTGLYGCQECLITFKEATLTTIERIHKGSEHLGKIPNRQKTHIHYQKTIKELEDKLEQAIQEERYEDAASIRDEMLQHKAKS